MACKYVLLDGAKGEIDEAADYPLAESGSKRRHPFPRDDSAGNRHDVRVPDHARHLAYTRAGGVPSAHAMQFIVHRYIRVIDNYRAIVQACV